MNNSSPEVDGPGGPQQFLNALGLQISNEKLRVEFRCMIDDKLMRKFELGKYEKPEPRVNGLLNSLRTVLESDRSVIPALTPNVLEISTAPLRHVHNRKKNLDSARELISKLTDITGDSAETVIKRALA